jgi:hypothetical protein
MKPKFAISGQYVNKSLQRDGYTKALEVNTKESSFQGRKWESLSDYHKRKFENLLVLNNTARDRTERIKILYV